MPVHVGMARLSWPDSNQHTSLMFSVHRRSQSSTRENSSEPRFDFNTPAKCDGSRRNGDKGQIHIPAQEPHTPQSRSAAQAETTQRTSRTPQNGSHFGELCVMLPAVAAAGTTAGVT